MMLPTLVLYEWLRGPRLAEELAAQEAVVPSSDAIPFGRHSDHREPVSFRCDRERGVVRGHGQRGAAHVSPEQGGGADGLAH
jgi:hypothetical protein